MSLFNPEPSKRGLSLDLSDETAEVPDWFRTYLRAALAQPLLHVSEHFETWMVDRVVVSGFLVTSNQAAGSSDIPAGLIAPYGGASAPSGWLVCDGTAVSRSDYADLFDAIGTGYGTGDGSTTFNLPDLQGRMAVGKGTHADVDALGDNDGAALASRRPKHRHSVSYNQLQPIGYGDPSNGNVTSGGGTGTRGTDVHVGPQSSSPTDAPAYVVVNFIVKT